jgi:hypothetical protein
MSNWPERPLNALSKKKFLRCQPGMSASERSLPRTVTEPAENRSDGLLVVGR